MRAVLLMALLFAVGCGAKPTAESGNNPPIETKTSPNAKPVASKPDRLSSSVNAGTLWLEYGENEARADEEYTGRRLTVGGDVHSVVKNGDGYEVRFMVFADEGSGRSLHGAIARFPASESGKVAKIREAQMCYFQGRCLGKSAGVRKGYTVIFEDCKIVPDPKS